MEGKLKWLSTVFICLWLLGCSHAPSPATKVAQQPTPQASAQVSTAEGLPAAEVPEKEFDFGVMAEDNSYVHEFKIVNKGTGVLEIQGVVPD